MRPRVLTFDVFGTVLDWRRGLSEALAAAGRPLAEAEFDRVVDRQGALEQEAPFRTYREITALSLVEVLGLAPEVADRIGQAVGCWPLYPDSAQALRGLMTHAPCVAMTNSDRAHGDQVQAALGFPLSGWMCAESLRRYKPHPGFWTEVARRLELSPDKGWWHVSAYADYDLGVAASLGLTTVFVRRPHARPGPAEHGVADLRELLALVERQA